MPSLMALAPLRCCEAHRDCVDRTEKMIALNGIDSWQAGQGSVTTWMASQATREIARQAARKSLPPSFQEAQHLRAAFYGQALGRPQPRLMMTAWDIPGVCDMAAMTTAVNAH